MAPIEKARQFFKDQLERKEFVKSLPEPEWALLYNGVDPETVIDEPFIFFCDEILGGIFAVGKDISSA